MHIISCILNSLANDIVNVQSRILKHLFYGLSFPTHVPVWGSMKPIPAVSDSRTLLLLLRVERLISLYSSCQCQFLKQLHVLQVTCKVMPENPLASVCAMIDDRTIPLFCVPNRHSGQMADLYTNIVECIHFCTLINKNIRFIKIHNLFHTHFNKLSKTWLSTTINKLAEKQVSKTYDTQFSVVYSVVKQPSP